MLVLDVGGGELEVEADVALEEHCLLEGDAHDLAQLILREVANVAAVDGDAPLGHVVEARHQVDQRRLARASSAQDADSLAGLHGEADVLQRRWIERAVGPLEREGDILECHATLDVGRVRRAHVVGVLHIGLVVDDLPDAAGRGVAAQHERDQDGHQGQRRDHQREVLCEGHDLTDLDAGVVEQLEPTDADGQGHRDLGDAGQDGVEHGHHEGGRECRLRSCVARSAKRCFSRPSRVKALTTRMPVRFSCSRLLSPSSFAWRSS